MKASLKAIGVIVLVILALSLQIYLIAEQNPLCFILPVVLFIGVLIGSFLRLVDFFNGK